MQRQGGAGRRHRHAQPVRAGLSRRPRRARRSAQARAAIKALHALGPRAVLVTSLHTDETPDDAIDLLASDADRPLPPAHAEAAAGGERRRRRHRRAVLCALSAQRHASTRRCRAPPPRYSACWPRPRRRARAKLQLVAAQDEIVKPSRVFEAQELAAHDAGSPSLFHVDRLELAFEPKPWAFADERRAEIDAFFAELQREKPALWNGRVLLLHHQVGGRRVSRRLSRNRLCEFRCLARLGAAARRHARLLRRGGDRRGGRRVSARRHGRRTRPMPGTSISLPARPIRRHRRRQGRSRIQRAARAQGRDRARCGRV